MHLHLIVVLLLVLSGCSLSPFNHDSDSDELARDEIALVTTTDFHATIDRAEGLAAMLQRLRARFGDKMFYFDGGDLFQGSLEGNLSKGRAVVELFNKLGADAAAIGNHELDYGPDVVGRTLPNPGENPRGALEARVRESKFTWISANFVYDQKTACTAKTKDAARCKKAKFNALGQHALFSPHVIFKRPGAKSVCAIGATTPLTPGSSLPAFMKGARVDRMEPAVAAEAKLLREKRDCDFVVLVVHAGVMCNSAGSCQQPHPINEISVLLEKLPKGTVDAVVAGHTHMRAQEMINGTPVIQAGLYGEVVGVLRLRGSKSSRQVRFEPFVAVPEAAPQQTEITKAMAPYRASANAIKARIVGTAAADFKRNYVAENPVANLVADSLRESGRAVLNAQMGFMNAGAIRGDLPAGEVTYGDLFKALPHDNDLVVAELRGSELRRMLEIAFSGRHGIPGVSGLHVTVFDASQIRDKDLQNPSISRDLNRDGTKETWERNTLLEVTDEAGVPLQDTQVYRVALPSSLAFGLDHQDVVFKRVPSQRIHIFSGVTVRDVVVEYFKQFPHLSPDMFFNVNRPRVKLVSPDNRGMN